MGAAFEVNRQMCDIEKDLSEAGYFRKICEGQIEARKKLIDMKKKKMTKAEAFEYLKHRKVAVVGDTCTIQNKLFEIGYTWCDGTIKVIPMVDFLLIDDETFQFTESLSHFKNCAYEEISADEILSIEIVEEADGLKYGSSWDEITRLGAQISKILDDMPDHCRVEITECTVNLYNEGVNLYHSDPF